MPGAAEEVSSEKGLLSPWPELFLCARRGDASGCEAFTSAKCSQDVNFQEPEHGNTALHVAAEEGHAEVVRVLLASHADPGTKNNYGLKPLELAALGSETFTLLKDCTAPGDAGRRGGFTLGERRASLAGI
mmetsp:Transcript_57308/g.92856  ORF Transcript_57308/g.92856 Transcript_57308/m.92856 type:complete len:131 (+) Transcript_57308:210-602(+)